MAAIIGAVALVELATIAGLLYADHRRDREAADLRRLTAPLPEPRQRLSDQPRRPVIAWAEVAPHTEPPALELVERVRIGLLALDPAPPVSAPGPTGPRHARIEGARQ
jgi:hypothetical protein